MKRLFFFFVTVLLAVNVLAEGRMKFKGIEMAGTPKEFVKQLQAKGFTYAGNIDGMEALIGDFAGYKDCKVFVISTNNEVVRVNVAFNDYNNWNALYENYTSIKNMLTTKYGQPSIDKEEWQGYGGKPNDDNRCLHELRMDRVKFFSEFESKEGSVELQLMRLNVTMCAVVLSYFDNQSQEKLKNNAIEDL